MAGLTLKSVERARHKPSARYCDGRGLYLEVRNPNNAYWVGLFTSPVLRRSRWMGLGSVFDFNLHEARELWHEKRKLIARGIDPIEARRTEKAQRVLQASKALTFEQAAQLYYRDHAHKWSNLKHAAQFLATLRDYAFPKIGKLLVSDIDTGSVLSVLKQIVPAKNKREGGVFYIVRAETSDRMRMRLEWVLDWCTVHKYRSGDNPARREVVRAGLPERGGVVKHFASMPYGRVPALMQTLSSRDGTAARALEFLILTASRTGEVLGAVWDEFDLEQKLWTIPAYRMKARDEHRVPLSDRAIEILRTLPREKGNPRVFIGPHKAHLSGAAMAALLDRMEIHDATVHGFRSSFRTWGEERTSYPHIVLEMALAHKVDDKVVRTYRRTDLLEKRRRLMDEWSRFCTSPSGDGQVVPIKAAS